MADLSSDGKRIRILVIEDEDSIRRLMSSILGLEGYDVGVFSTASEGLKAFAERPSDIVITDLGLPDQSGWEVARQIKKASPGTPVILITGWGVTFKPEEAKRRGVDYFLAKPFEFSELSERLSRALGDLDRV